MVPWHDKLMSQQQLREVTIARIIRAYGLKDRQSIESAFNEAYTYQLGHFVPEKVNTTAINVFMNWLFKTTYDRLCDDRILWRCNGPLVDGRRKRYRIARHFLSLKATRAKLLRVDPSPDFENQEFCSELLLQLSEQERQIVELHLWGGWMLKDIPVLIGSTYSITIKAWQRAIRKMKEYCEMKGLL